MRAQAAPKTQQTALEASAKKSENKQKCSSTQQYTLQCVQHAVQYMQHTVQYMQHICSAFNVQCGSPGSNCTGVQGSPPLCSELQSAKQEHVEERYMYLFSVEACVLVANGIRHDWLGRSGASCAVLQTAFRSRHKSKVMMAVFVYARCAPVQMWGQAQG
eukprot:1161932-Pelagomonas_calceolata.AAC.9